MIVRFSVSNFLSFDYSDKPKDCINMRPSRIKQKWDHVIDDYNVLRSMVMFGGNGAGKSSIIKALSFLKRIVTTGWLPNPDDGYYCKNRLENMKRPIRMEIEIINPRSEKDVSFEMDYLFLGMNAWDRRKNPEQDDIPWEHFRYVIELGYLGDDVPYNVNHESLSRMYMGREFDIYEHQSQWTSEKYDRIRADKKSQLMRKLDLARARDNVEVMLKETSKELSGAEKQKKTLMKRKEETLAFLRNFQAHSHDEVSGIDTINGIHKQLLDLEDEINDLEKMIKKDNQKFEELSKQNTELTNELMLIEMKSSTDSFKNSLMSTSFIYRIRNEKKLDLNRWKKYRIASSIYDWFLNTLVIVDIKGMVMPINGFDDLEKLNALLPHFDAHIRGLSYVPVVSQKEISDIYYETKYGNAKEISELLEFSKSNLGRQSTISHIVTTRNNIYQLNYSESRLTINKLVTVHHDGTIHQLVEESDGTHRLIELISVLIRTDTDKVYIIDELDRRLHPLITKNFIDMYYKLELDNTQLIITTHETRLATTEMFRMDEINLVSHDENYCTVVRRANEVVKDRDKRLDEMYLNNMLGGTPQISD